MHLSQVHALPWPLLFCPVSYAIFICFLCSIFCVFDTHLAVTSQSTHWCHGKLATAPQSFVKVGKSNSKSEVARGQSREKGLPTPSALPLLSPPVPLILCRTKWSWFTFTASRTLEVAWQGSQSLADRRSDDDDDERRPLQHRMQSTSVWRWRARAGGGRSAGVRAGGGMGRTADAARYEVK